MTLAATPVLIVGGSLAGLSTALFLGAQGVPCTVVERERHRSVQFRFGGIHARTMELYRSVGVEDDIRAACADLRLGDVARAHNLADPKPRWLTLPWHDEPLSPTGFCYCPQDRLEPVLARHARRHGATIHFGTELRSCTQDGDGVTAVVADASGAEREVRARYLVAADGAHGHVRPDLGIGRHGPGILEQWLSIVFRCELAPRVAGREFWTVMIAEPNGSLVSRADGVWQLAITYQPGGGQPGPDELRRRFTDERCLELIRTATARPDLAATVLDVMPWQASAFTADRFADGRIFLVGDAAHVMPPTGAFGGNAGIQDAHNLAWKLAAVLGGAAGPALLDTYAAEREPVAERTTTQALIRLGDWFRTTHPDMPTAPPADENTVMFGYQYGGDAFVDPRGVPAPVGTRAPHVPLDRDGVTVSTLDLLGRGCTVLTGPAGQSWCAATRDLAPGTGNRLDCRQLRADDGGYAPAFGIEPDGAVLVRPDGFLAWRAPTMVTDPTSTLREALARLLHRA